MRRSIFCSFFSRSSVLALAFLSLSALIPTSASAATTLDIVSFNVRWFGVRVNDPRGKPTPIDPKVVAQRLKVMRDFMSTVVKPKDVVVFQEVVDLPSLKNILPQGWQCLSYKHSNPNNQHVAVCVSSGFQFMPVPYDKNAVIEQVAMDPDWGRPAMRFDLGDKSGNKLLRLVGVHLKSAPEFTSTRVQQMQMIAKDLKQDHKVPTLIVGDMNVYWPVDTKQPQPDINYLLAELKKTDPSFTLVKHTVPYTYRSPRFKNQFDQIYVNDMVKVQGPPKVFQVCNQTKDGPGYLNFLFYFNNVSDHCPTRVTVTVPN